MKLSQKLFLLTTLPLTCYAGPPFITDDPSPVDYHHAQIIPFAMNLDNYLGSDVTFPGLEIDYGLLPRLEINTVISYIHNNSSNRTSQFPSGQGIGDTQLGIKYELWQETDAYPQTAFAPVYFLPTGNSQRGLGNGRGWGILPIWLQKTWGTWTCYGGGGYALNGAPQMKNYFFGGAVLQKQLNETWLLGGEIFSQGATSHYISSTTFINLGGIYNFNSNLQGLFSLGHTLIGTSSVIGYIGLQWNI